MNECSYCYRPNLYVTIWNMFLHASNWNCIRQWRPSIMLFQIGFSLSSISLIVHGILLPFVCISNSRNYIVIIEIIISQYRIHSQKCLKLFLFYLNFFSFLLFVLLYIEVIFLMTLRRITTNFYRLLLFN